MLGFGLKIPGLRLGLPSLHFLIKPLVAQTPVYLKTVAYVFTFSSKMFDSSMSTVSSPPASSFGDDYRLLLATIFLISDELET